MVAATMAASAAPVSAAKTAKQIRQCKALNKCRDEFTRCYYAIERDPKKTWETHEWECAKPYGECIDRNFGMFDMLFTRLFDPRVQDCSK
jgi:hypothetical protein